jgi:DNA-binding CsgD family transcriptional regulator
MADTYQGTAGIDFGGLVAALQSAADPKQRFDVFSGALGRIGIDQINYGFFDPAAASEAEAEVLFLSTMRSDWLEYYYDRDMHVRDPHVVLVRQGNLMPYRWGGQAVAAIEQAPVKDAARQIEEAGIVAALCVPLTSPFAPARPIAGMTLGSTLPEDELRRLIGDKSPHLVSLTHLFHDLSLGALHREHLGASPLSPREKECLQLIADGLKQDALADRLGLSLPTVELHLRNARRKLKARTLAQAVARALRFREIEL